MNEINRFEKTSRPKLKIVGAADIEAQGPPQILDRTTKQEQTIPEIRVHNETVTEDERVRSQMPRRVDEPQVRIRAADKKAWDKAKRAED